MTCDATVLRRETCQRPLDSTAQVCDSQLSLSSCRIVHLFPDRLANHSSFAPTPWWLQEPKENREFARTHIIPTLHPHQRLMVVPGLYGNDSATPAEHALQDERLLAKLDAYWEWIQDDTRMVGLNPYHWTDTNACLLKNTSACTHMCYDGVCGTSQAGIPELLTRIAHSPSRAPSHSLWTFVRHQGPHQELNEHTRVCVPA